MATHRKLKLPLPRGFFSCPPLCPEARNEYIHQGQQALFELVERTRLRGGPIEWTFDRESHGVSVYRGVDPVKGDMLYLRTTQVQASLKEAAQLFGAGTNGRDYCATYGKDQTLDIASLYTLANPTPEHPHNTILIKWVAINLKVAKRDFCYIEYQDDFTVDNVQGFGRCFRSIELPTVCPNFEKLLGLVRGHIVLSGEVFFKSNRSGYLTFCQVYQNDMKTNFATEAILQWYSRIALLKKVSNVETHLRQERINHSFHILPIDQLVPRPSRSKCYVCTHRFTPLSKKENCRQCGEVVCRSCSQVWHIPQMPIPLRVCTICTSSDDARSTLDSSDTYEGESPFDPPWLEDDVGRPSPAIQVLLESGRCISFGRHQETTPQCQDTIQDGTEYGSSIAELDMEYLKASASKQQLRELYRQLRELNLDDLEAASDAATVADANDVAIDFSD
ncbi:unnamed protein product [Aphanomyces euteiches]|uniref:FYVE-type domain-containing protein n=1 Tax=Aphanomyces euteiches TaxID=100861 RepID=A0A6G0W8G3_9STRA|nr:hypothetical protein Ae201684_017550 [Aphanomyces euteiches]KAH9068870.1 hypothetical protein Ae201684P_004568 [Aphanomyces euteiches]KAH9155359.1 hypothetical protein AeRB84_002654 [Aphanomyces euteiches]